MTLVAGMTTDAAATIAPVDVDQALELVVHDARQPASTSVRGELVGAADELVSAFALTLVASPQTRRTYDRACRAFTAWLGPLAGPEDLTAANVAAYHAELVRSGRASSTVKKERAALNTFLRWLVEFEHISAQQARQALAVKLPRAQQASREAPKALSAGQYDDLLRAAKAAIADDPLAGARDLAIILVLGDAGLRCEELAGLERRDVQAARRGATLRTLNVRHGKGDRGRAVKLSKRATAAIVRWERARVAVLGAPAHDAALFITLGRRKADGTYAGVGRRCGQPALAAVISGSARPRRSPRSCVIRMHCATRARRSCCAAARTSRTCARSSGMRRSRPRRSTWRQTSSARRTS